VFGVLPALNGLCVVGRINRALERAEFFSYRMSDLSGMQRNDPNASPQGNEDGRLEGALRIASNHKPRLPNGPGWGHRRAVSNHGFPDAATACAVALRCSFVVVAGRLKIKGPQQSRALSRRTAQRLFARGHARRCSGLPTAYFCEFEVTGSSPLFLIVAIAAGDARNSMSVLAAFGSLAPAAMPAENTVIF
jgi:hypothetical protein